MTAAIIDSVVGRVSSPHLVGRGEELAALESALVRAREGDGSIVIVASEAGMGKSRLISELARRAEASDMTVAVGECVPLAEGEIPYAPIVVALRSLLRQSDGSEHETLSAPRELAALMPELSSRSDAVTTVVGATGTQARLFEQVLALLSHRARTKPLVLVVEDCQWADRSTRDLLAFLVRATRREPIAMVVSYRIDELQHRHPLRPFVRELERSGRATRIELGPFTRDELRDQVTGILDEAPPPPLVDRLLERSEGNPYFTEELLASSRGPDVPLPRSLRDILLSRVEPQSGAVRDVLRIVAVAGRTIEHALLAVVTNLSEEELNRSLRDAVESYLLTHGSSSGTYSFRHALLREAVYGDLLPGERRPLHLGLARALEEHSELAAATAAGAAERAYHLYEAGHLPAALAASISAGTAAEGVAALGEAWLHYERAIEVWDRAARSDEELPLSRLEVLRRAADAALLTGEQERAITLARDVLARIEADDAPDQAALAYERLGRYLWTAGRDEDALTACRRAVKLVADAPPSTTQALMYAAEGQVLMLCNRTTESIARCEEALAIARKIHAEAVEAHVLNTTCANLSAAGEFDQAIRAARSALAIARRLGLAEEMNRSYMNGSDALDEAGHIAESIAMAWDGINSAREFGYDRQWGDLLRGEVAGRLLQIGRWQEAEQVLEEVIDRSPTGVNAGMAYRNLGYLWAERGAFEAATRALDQAEEQVRHSTASMTLGPRAAARASLELWASRPAAATSIVSECLERIGDSEYVFFTARVYELGTRACAEIAAQAPGDGLICEEQTATARKLLERLDGRIARLTGVIPPMVRASRTAAAGECSRIGRAGDGALWADARRQWEACENRHHAAYARLREAEALLARGGNRADAATLVREAHAVADALGARPLLEQLQALARRARIDLDDGGRSETAADAVLRFELTPRELDVLALLAGGLTNREIGAELFISNKTASVHVSRILGKLSVPNRAAAAAFAQRLGVAPTNLRR